MNNDTESVWRCDAAKEVLQEWVDKQGHERCWYYPEIFRKLCNILHVMPSKDPALPPLEEFKGGVRAISGGRI